MGCAITCTCTSCNKLFFVGPSLTFNNSICYMYHYHYPHLSGSWQFDLQKLCYGKHTLRTMHNTVLIKQNSCKTSIIDDQNYKSCNYHLVWCIYGVQYKWVECSASSNTNLLKKPPVAYPIYNYIPLQLDI